MTWTGRGMKLGWVKAALKGGKTMDDLLIARTRKGKRKRKQPAASA